MNDFTASAEETAKDDFQPTMFIPLIDSEVHSTKEVPPAPEEPKPKWAFNPAIPDRVIPGPKIPFRIQFATDCIRPRQLPSFPYIATRIEFGAILFTSITYGSNTDDATGRVLASWPSAEIRYIEEGTGEFRLSDELKTAHVFGAVVAKPQNWFARLFGRVLP